MLDSVSFHVSRVVLLEIVTAFLCRGEFTLTTNDHNVVMEMCHAQNRASCSDQNISCANASRGQEDFVGSTWLLRCNETDTNQTDAECEGSCSKLASQKGYVPARPNVSVTREPLTHAVELSWKADLRGTPEVVYVIASSHTNDTDMPELWEVVNATFRSEISDICWIPQIRVAAVSRSGSRWFSDLATVPDLIPGPPKDINLTQLNYDPDINREFIYYTLEWHPPDGWSARDLNVEHRFQYTTECDRKPFLIGMQLLVDTWRQFHVKTPTASATQGAFCVTGRIPVDAVGCNITFSIQAVSRCASAQIGAAGEYKFNLSCDQLPNYTSSNCGSSPVVVPGQVKDARFLIVPDADGLVGLVSWRPPDRMGSFPRVAAYHVFWGLMDLMNSDLITQFTSLLGHVTVPGTELETELDLHVTWLHPEETVGVMITAAGQGQVIDMPFSDIYLPANGITSASDTGSMLADDNTVLVLETETDGSRGADIFWRRTQVHDLHNLALSYDVQWGLVSPGENNANETSHFTPINITRVEQAYISLPVLQENISYGIKIVPVFNVSSDVYDENDDVWNQTELHNFTMRPGRVTRQHRLNSSLPYTPPTATLQPDAAFNPIHLIVLVVSGLLASACALLLYVRLRRRQQRLGAVSVVRVADTQYRDYSLFSPGTSLDVPPVAHCPLVADEWELPLSCVKFGHVLGSGAFGTVVQGQVTRAMLTHRGVSSLLADAGSCFDDANKLHVTVAIKMLQADCDSKYKQDFLKEIQLMKTLGQHRNVVSMLGCCTLRDPICLVVEHAEFGDLLNYLKDVRHKMIAMASVDCQYVNRDMDTPSSKDLVRFACQVALGMDFLASKGFVHRDLAARNVLMCANRTCKIGDFGLARYIYDNVVYVNRRGGRLPVKWMSVEAIFDMSFSTASDVWSFGILLYEIVSLGGTPYPTIPTRDLLRELLTGYRMDKPENCSSQMYEMMTQCWQANPHDRPTFSQLSQWLQTMIEDGSETDHLDVQLGLDRRLYKADEDAAFCVEDDLVLTPDQDSLTTCDTSAHPRVETSHCQDTDIVCCKSVSGDSGYSSQQKESVSSGGSTLTLPAPSDTSPWNVAMPNSELSTHFPGELSENVLDDVFHEDGVVVDNGGDIPLVTNCENLGSSSSKLTSGVCQLRRRRLGQGWAFSSKAVIHKSKDKSTPYRHQSLKEQSLSAQSLNCINHNRRKSDSDILVSPKVKRLQTPLTIRKFRHKTAPTIEMIHHKSSSKTTDTPRKTRDTAGNKQRRKAVVIPPTLALDNELYQRGVVLRQNPPVICISRRAPRNKGSEFINADTWTCDGEFNFKRAVARETEDKKKVSSSIRCEIESSTVDTDKPLDHNTRHNVCIVEAQVHRDCSMEHEEQDTTNKNLMSLSCQNFSVVNDSQTKHVEATSLLHHGHQSPRRHRTFGRSHLSSVPTDTPWRKGTGKQERHEKIPRLVHEYADFKHVIKQSGQNSEVSGMGNEEACSRTDVSCGLEKLVFDPKAMLDASHGFKHREMGQRFQSSQIVHVNGRRTCKTISHGTGALDSLSQAVRRTYSSPKEHTLTGIGLIGEDQRLKERVSFLLRRRLSDPFVLSNPEADSPGHQCTCFLWTQAFKRKDATTDRCPGELDPSTRKYFPHEKHPAALHQVSHRDVS